MTVAQAACAGCKQGQPYCIDVRGREALDDTAAWLPVLVRAQREEDCRTVDISSCCVIDSLQDASACAVQGRQEGAWDHGQGDISCVG